MYKIVHMSRRVETNYWLDSCDTLLSSLVRNLIVTLNHMESSYDEKSESINLRTLRTSLLIPTHARQGMASKAPMETNTSFR